MKKKWELSRRTFLRGLGATVALPLLEQMLPSIARAQSEPVRRLVAFYIPNGMIMRNYTPRDEGPQYTLTPMLQALAPHREDFLVLTNLANRTAKKAGVVAPHSLGTAAFLTAATPQIKDGPDIYNAVSMDQLAAQALKGRTRFPSLELGIDAAEAVGDCERTYACAYLRHISWAGPTQPVAKEVDPSAAFDRLFGGGGALDPARAEQERRRRQSVLDAVKEDADGLQRRLGRSDRLKLDEYLTGVREVEQRVAGMAGAGNCAAGSRPDAAVDIREHSRAMLDLLVMALQCDQTRMASFMLGNGRSRRVFDFLGVAGRYHTISHHGGQETNMKAIEKIKAWEVGELAYLLEKMKAVQEPDGTLLDNSLVYFGSEVEDPNAHNYFNLPVILAGRGGGAVKPGRHIRYTEEQSVGSLFVSMLATVGVDVPSFGDGVGPLPGLEG